MNSIKITLEKAPRERKTKSLKKTHADDSSKTQHVVLIKNMLCPDYNKVYD